VDDPEHDGRDQRGGRVRIHAPAMFLATPHRTAESRLVAPTPMIADVIVWVVDTGACSANALT
jgi:hypothetical protein